MSRQKEQGYYLQKIKHNEDLTFWFLAPVPLCGMSRQKEL